MSQRRSPRKDKANSVNLGRPNGLFSFSRSPRSGASSPHSDISDGYISKSRALSEINEEGDHSSDDTDREDERNALKVKTAVKLEEKKKKIHKEVNELENQLKRERNQNKLEMLRQKYRNSKRQVTVLETQIQCIMDTPTASLRITAHNTGARGEQKKWVRALYDYKPVGKKGHTWFTYDEIIEVLDDDVKVDVSTKTEKLDFMAFLAEADEGDEEEGGRIMRGKVIGSQPLRIGLFPSRVVADVRFPAKDFCRPDEKRPKTVLGIVRGKVSKKKRRFMAEGFDLDLSYITPRIIAMGIPASDMSAFYRNNLDEVIKFLEHFHKDHYQLYNLCDDRSYPTKKFHDRVVQYGFEDHNPCPFDMMEPFCEHLNLWLSKNEKNIAAIHCKAGKGRTGLMISAYLIYNQQHKESFSALRYFAVKRTKNSKGVTIPSQMRYVDYFRRYLDGKRHPERGMIPRSRTMRILSIILDPAPKHIEQGTCFFNIDTFNTMELTGVNKLKSMKNKDRIDIKEGTPPPDAVLKRHVNSYKAMKKISHTLEGKSAVWRTGTTEVIVEDDVRLTFVFRARYSMKKKKVFQLWFNTRFLEVDLKGNATLRLKKSQIDKLCKDLKNSTVPADFTITVHFQAC